MKGFTISGTPAQVKELTQKLLDTHGNIPVKDLPCLTCPWHFERPPKEAAKDGKK